MDFNEFADYESTRFIRRRVRERFLEALSDVEVARQLGDLRAWEQALERLTDAQDSCNSWGIRIP